MEVNIIGVPSDFGANRRGVDMGPSAMRYAGLINKIERLNKRVNDLGDINLPQADCKDSNQENIKCLNQIVETCNLLATKVENSIKNNKFPIILGGDHSITMGSLAGVVEAKNRIGLIWIDAHGDFNTDQTTETGNIHGMPLAAIAGQGLAELVSLGGVSPKLAEENIVLIGVRDLDEGERTLLKESNITVFTMDDIDKLGMFEVIQRAIEISSANVEGVHLSFDIDVVDPIEAPGVGTPVCGGITYREAHLALEALAEAKILTSMDLVEVNPILDKYNKTADLAVDLITSLLGKRIL